MITCIEHEIVTEDLLVAIATHAARRRWRLMGARSQGEAYSFILTAMRRRWAITAMRGFARLRLSRARYVQDVDVRRGRELAAAAGAPMTEDAYLPAHSPAAFQAGVEGQGGAGHGPTMGLALD